MSERDISSDPVGRKVTIEADVVRSHRNPDGTLVIDEMANAVLSRDISSDPHPSMPLNEQADVIVDSLPLGDRTSVTGSPVTEAGKLAVRHATGYWRSDINGELLNRDGITALVKNIEREAVDAFIRDELAGLLCKDRHAHGSAFVTVPCTLSKDLAAKIAELRNG